jgi:hypothetical protein
MSEYPDILKNHADFREQYFVHHPVEQKQWLADQAAGD